MTAQKEEWVQVGLWRYLKQKSNIEFLFAGEKSDFLYLSLQLLFTMWKALKENTKQNISPDQRLKDSKYLWFL